MPAGALETAQDGVQGDDQEVANRDRVDGRSLPQLQITACAHETVQRVPPQLRTLLQVLLRPHALGFAKHPLAANDKNILQTR